MLLTDLREVKSILDIDPNDPTEDKNLNFFVEWASKWIGEILNRPGFSYQLRTEFYSGTGTQKLLLRHRPVFINPLPIVYVDENAFWGASSGSFDPGVTQLTYGVDFALKIDQPDGVSSRCAILYRINEFWPRPTVRQMGYLSPFIWDDTGSIKITYQAGWTVDTLPAVFRMACNTLVARMRYFFPLGVPLSSESYEERSISIMLDKKDYLLSQVKDLILPYRNQKW